MALTNVKDKFVNKNIIIWGVALCLQSSAWYLVYAWLLLCAEHCFGKMVVIVGRFCGHWTIILFLFHLSQ